MINKRLVREEMEFCRDYQPSIFWITATKARARRIDWLEKHGVIVRNREHPQDHYPYCVFDVHPEKLEELL